MAKKKYSGQRIKRLRITAAAQQLMDALYDKGFVIQSISNYEPGGGDTADFYFLAEQGPRRERPSLFYEGAGSSLLRAIRSAINSGVYG